MEGGLTQFMRGEHSQIGQALEAVHKKVQMQDPECDQEEQALRDLLTVHNQKAPVRLRRLGAMPCH